MEEGFGLIACPIAVCCRLVATGALLFAQTGHTTWSDYGGGADSSKYMELTEITKADVSKLTVAWTY